MTQSNSKEIEMKHEWDDLAEYFNAYVDNGKMPSGAADNVMIAWPVMLAFLQHYLSRGHVIDYGCGTGGFTAKLASLGYSASGLDPSPQMIANGRMLFKNQIKLQQGNAKALIKPDGLDAISSIMALHFADNDELEQDFAHFKDALHIHGLLIFAVFNPKYVAACIEKNVKFSNFDSNENPTQATLSFRNIKQFKTYIRSASEYNMRLGKYGFVNLLEAYPEFTEKFLEEYPLSGPTHVSEYVILGYVLTSIIARPKIAPEYMLGTLHQAALTYVFSAHEQLEYVSQLLSGLIAFRAMETNDIRIRPNQISVSKTSGDGFHFCFADDSVNGYDINMSTFAINLFIIILLSEKDGKNYFPIMLSFAYDHAKDNKFNISKLEPTSYKNAIKNLMDLKFKNADSLSIIDVVDCVTRARVVV